VRDDWRDDLFDQIADIYRVRAASWWHLAECRKWDVPQDWFFPSDGVQSPNRRGLALCSVCPVASECLEHALKLKEHGVWGGTGSKRTRDKIRMAREDRAVA